MKAAILKKYGGPESLIYYTNTKKPELSNSEQLLIRVTAVALSTLDAEVRSGDWEKIQDNNFDEGVGESSEGAGLKDQPYILGYEFSGVVEAVGSAVTRFQAREEVCGLCSIVKRNGACAEYIVIDENFVTKKPQLVLDDDAALAIGPGVFSVTALHYNLKVNRNSSILICDGATPEGFVLIQYAAALGLRIFVTACSQEHVSFLEDFGNTVARVIDELQEDLADIVMEETDGIGVDYIVETKALRATSDSPSNMNSGGKGIEEELKPEADTNAFRNPFKVKSTEYANKGSNTSLQTSSTISSPSSLDPIQRKRSLLKSLAAHGSWVTRSKTMQLDPDETEIMALKNASLSFIFPQAWLLSPSKQGKFLHVLDAVMRSVAEGKLRPLPCTSFNLSQIREAHRFLENEHDRIGRVLIKI
eukprot:g12879.t1